MPVFNQLTPDIIAELEKISPGRVMTGADINPDYARDEMPIYGTHMPDASIDVLSTEEISAVMKVCNAHRIPVTVRGAGTGLVGACVPVAGGVVLCTMKMNNIISYDLENFCVTVQPGVLLKDLAEDALKKGMMYPPDPGEKLATLGGNAATNAGGMRAVKYGTTRDYVRAATVVLPSGEIVRLGSEVTKTSSGYSLLNLIVGSEGTLAVITELTLRLIPAPKHVLSLIVPFADLDICISSVPKFLMAGHHPQALEFFEKEILISSEEYLSKQIFPRAVNGKTVGAYLLITLDGEHEDVLYADAERAADHLMSWGALEVFVADTPPRLRDAWAARSSFLEGIEEQMKLVDEVDVVVPVDRIADYVRMLEENAKDYDFALKYFGHAGDGNLHIYTCSNDMEPDEFNRQTAKFFDSIYSTASEMHGQISGEHGIGMGKIRYLEESAGPVSIALMRGIKDVFDPNGILNPGKVCRAL